jgi:hypothetical protein
MSPDTQIISIIQIALIGILVVLGLFFLWRKIQRLEQRVEGLQGMLEHCSLCPVAGSVGGAINAGLSANVKPKSPVRQFGVYEAVAAPEADADADADDDTAEYADDEEEEEYGIDLNPEEEAAIQRIFKESLGGDATFMVFNPFGFATAVGGATTTVPVHTVLPESSSPVIEEVTMEETDADTTTGTRFTKTKLSKMNVEQLKDVLGRHHLSTEGTKKQLFERALNQLVETPKTIDA